MTFQFTCPQGHLLEGDAAHAGMQSQCPMCGTLFIIPQPIAGTPGPETPSGDAGQAPGEPGAFPGLQFGPNIAPGPQTVEAPNLGPPQDDEDRIVHILCPNGHELETPMSMVGSDAMCPHCSAEFRLRYEDSRESKEEKQKERERREAAFGRKALHWAIVTAALVMLLLLGLMVASTMNQTPR
jgi:hypothetical protein